jgi:hypothetical protein
MRVVVLGLILSFASGVHAAGMSHTDLTSLVHQSTDVVMGAEVREGVYRVTVVHKGPLARGAEIKVLTDAIGTWLPPTYRRKSAGQYETVDAPPREPRALLFLVRQPDGRYFPVPSGMRLYGGGRVYRLEQQNNPGPYEPVPQGQDPLDVFGLDAAQVDQVPATEADFNKMFEAAKLRAARVAAAKTNAERLALLGPPLPFPAVMAYGRGFAVDEAAGFLVDAVIATGVLDDILEALARHMRHPSQLLLPDPRLREAKRLEVLAAARDLRRPVHQRAAAVSLLGTFSGADDVKPQLVELVPLLSDAVPAVRAAAAGALADLGRTACGPYLVTAAGKEKDGEVLLVIAHRLANAGEKFEKQFHALHPFLFTIGPGPRPLDVSFQMITPGMRTSPSGKFRLRLSQGAKIIAEVDEHERLSSYLGGNRSGGMSRFQVSVPPGVYQARMVYEVYGKAGVSNPIDLTMK